MSVRKLQIYLIDCDGCAATYVELAAISLAEMQQAARFAGWHVGESWRATCPDCQAEAAENLERRIVT
jgi:hypothetical protein